MIIKFVTIFLSSIIFFIVLELIRRERLTFKYAFGWLAVSILAVFLTVFDRLLFQTADFFGFELTSNFIFFTLLAVFVFFSLIMTIFLCDQNNRIDKIIQKLGILEFELNELNKKREDKR
ncbi:MAG: DUF2304 domain-containing protein [Candidatus Omnitrophica bacterium]|nr:DUF2304 domain-containing protein [Candidatus Omnitrophota bacterium]